MNYTNEQMLIGWKWVTLKQFMRVRLTMTTVVIMVGAGQDAAMIDGEVTPRNGDMAGSAVCRVLPA